jgi:hypothetical protein
MAAARPSNLATGLRRRRRGADPMAEFDRLPPDLRRWLALAALPWSPRSARRAYARGLAATGGDKHAALDYLASLQAARSRSDAARTWGPSHPAAATPEERQGT